jgi:hypothetical protein
MTLPIRPEVHAEPVAKLRSLEAQNKRIKAYVKQLEQQLQEVKYAGRDAADEEQRRAQRRSWIKADRVLFGP